MKIFTKFVEKLTEPKVPKQKFYKFGMQEIAAIGDRYEYTVKADNKQEAFDKLIKYFFADKDAYRIANEDVKSTHHTVTQPQKDSFTHWNMPYWFAKRISGDVRNRDKGYDYQRDLEVYAAKRGISLDKNA